MRPVNARLNIAHLAARSSTYLVDYYGAMEGINKGLPSDRLLVDWYLDDLRVVARAESRPVPEVDAVRVIDVPRRRPDGDDAGEGLIAAQAKMRQQMQEAFAEGLEVSGFDLDRNAYQLTPRQTGV